MKYSAGAEALIEKYVAYKVAECSDDELAVDELREDLLDHLKESLDESGVNIVTEFDLQKQLAAMGELAFLKSLREPVQSQGIFVRDADFSIRQRKWILSTGLFLLCFFCFKFLVFDGLSVPEGESIKEVGPRTYRYENNPLRFEVADDPQLAEMINRSQTFKLLLLIGLSAGVSFWFWMLVECLLGEKYPKAGVFFQRAHRDRWVWLLVFVFLHVFGALIYKIVVNRKLKLEAANV